MRSGEERTGEERRREVVVVLKEVGEGLRRS